VKISDLIEPGHRRKLLRRDGAAVVGTSVWTQNVPATGVLTGSMVFTDPAGRTLSYSTNDCRKVSV
jgi:hypothetical protein